MADEDDIEIDIVDSDDPEPAPTLSSEPKMGYVALPVKPSSRSTEQSPTQLSPTTATSTKSTPLNYRATANHPSPETTSAASGLPRPTQFTTRPSASDVEPSRSTSDYRIPDWIDHLEDDDRQEKENDFKSQEAIANMLAEEEYYTGVMGRIPSSYTFTTNRPAGPGPIRSTKYKQHDAKKRKNSDDRSSQPKRAASRDSRPSTTSADLPSHNTRWSKDEDDRLLHGLELYGYGSWKLIAAVVGTRNALQVKNHARHWKMSHKIPGDLASASEGERLERSRSAATTSADEDDDDTIATSSERGKRQRHTTTSRSPRIKWMETNVSRSGSCEPVQRRQSRAQSMTSESGNEDFTGSEFGATSGYDTDCESRRSVSKSPSLVAREQHWRSPKIIPYVPRLPSPKIAPTMASSPYSSSPSHRNAISSMDEDEDVDIEIESSEGEAKLLNRRFRKSGSGGSSNNRRHFDRTTTSKSRSISPFSTSSLTSRSRPSSEYDSDSDTEGRHHHHHQSEIHYIHPSSPGPPSDVATNTTTSSSDFYTSTNFNTSSSSINSTYTSYSATGATAPKPSLKESSSGSIQRSLSHDGHYAATLLEKSQSGSSSTKERRTVSFGAVHVAELQPDVNSHDEEDLFSDGNNNHVPQPQPQPQHQPSTPSPGSTTSSASPKYLSSRLPSLSATISPPSPRHGQLHHHQQDLPLTSRMSNASVTSSRESSVARTDDEPTYEDKEDEEEAFLGSLRPPAHSQTDHSGSMMAGSSNNNKSPSRVRRPSPGRHIPPSSALTTQGIGLPHMTSNYGDSSHVHTYQPTTMKPYQHFPPSTSFVNTATDMSQQPLMPVRETIIDKNIITEEEKMIHAEFFCNKASKTPERYQRIRNTILITWERVRPHYVTKTSVRAGLKDCGDVNAIGRVHSWLESIGAINVGLTANSPGASLARPRNGGNQRKKAQMRVEAGYSNYIGNNGSNGGHAHRSSGDQHEALELEGGLDYLGATVQGPRRRRVRNERGEWVDEKDLEGRVVDHSVRAKSTDIDDLSLFTAHGLTREELEEEYEQQRLAAMNAKYFADSEALPPAQSWIPKNKRAQHFLRQQQQHSHHHHHHHHTSSYDQAMDEGGVVGSKYDPFRLVPLRRYGAKHPAPFRVIVSSDAMVVMDFHAHLAHTEIIGLLGGSYHDVAKELRIESVFPCKSLSTGLQCEMDPASEMEARDYFEQRGMVVVGWYHSHPTFEPNPSIRDIENQVNYQDLFRRPQDGIEPFVGVIVSPYDPMSLAMCSKTQFLSVSQHIDDRLGCRVPYACDREISPTDELSVKLFDQLSELVKEYRSYEHRVNLSLALRASSGSGRGSYMDTAPSTEAIITTRLEKLLRSLSANIYVDEVTASTFLDKVKELVVRGFQLGHDLMNIPSIKERNDLLSTTEQQQQQQQTSRRSTVEQPAQLVVPRDAAQHVVGAEDGDDGGEEDVDVLMESGKVSPPAARQDPQGTPYPLPPSTISQGGLAMATEPLDEDIDIEGQSPADYEMRSVANSPKS